MDQVFALLRKDMILMWKRHLTSTMYLMIVPIYIFTMSCLVLIIFYFLREEVPMFVPVTVPLVTYETTSPVLHGEAFGKITS